MGCAARRLGGARMTAPAGSSPDPFSRFEEALGDALRGYAPLAALVKVGNFVLMTGPRDNPFESSSATNDYPELQLWHAGANVAPGAIPRTSDTYFWHQRYSLGISTDQIRTNTARGVNAMKWACLRAVARAERTLVKPAIPFVTWIKPGDFRDQFQDVNPNGRERGVAGWKGVLDLEVQFQFAIAELMA